MVIQTTSCSTSQEIESFQEFYQKNHKWVLTSAFFYLKDMELAEDATQEIFYHLFERKSYLKVAQGALRSYVKTCIRNKCIAVIQKESSRSKLQIEFSNNYQEEITFPMDWQLRKAINEAINELPPKYKLAFVLTQIEGNSYEYAAKKLSVTKETIKTEVKGALKKLRAKLLPFK